MLPELLLLTVTATTPLERAWQVEAAGWERLSGECLAELEEARAERGRLRLALQGAQERAAPPASPTPTLWRQALLGGLLGASAAGGAAAGIGCEDARCRGAGIAVGAAGVIVALVALLAQ